MTKQSFDPRTPVIVGAAAVTQRVAETGGGHDALELMVQAVRDACDDAGRPDLAGDFDLVAVPRGTWSYRNAAYSVRHQLGTVGATRDYEVGLLQTGILNEVAAEIAAGDLDTAVVVGGEAKFRDLQAAKAGIEVRVTPDGDAPEPADLRTPTGIIVHPVEIEQRFIVPVQQYATIESAARFAAGHSFEAHNDLVARQAAAFAEIAASNPAAWHRDPRSADQIATPSADNKPLAFPYNKWHSTQWNVDQSAALILCSLAKAQALGLDDSGWVFPLVGADSDHAVPLMQRSSLVEAPAIGVAAAEVLAHASAGIDDVAHRELYSCFPVAVAAQARELQIDAHDATVTGGMTFAGGPFNNFVLQAMVKMVETLRESPENLGFNTAVSGMLTKGGCTLFGSSPGDQPFRHIDVTGQVAQRQPALPVTSDSDGRFRVLGYTVTYDDPDDRLKPTTVLAVGETPAGERTLRKASNDEAALFATQNELCGAESTDIGDVSSYAFP